MPNIITLADMVLQRIIWRRATSEVYDDYVSHSLAIAMRYIRMFYPAIVIVALMAYAYVPTAYAHVPTPTGECTRMLRNGMCANYYTRITEDSLGWDCTTMGNLVCAPGYTYYPTPH